ncbi:MAG: LacI family DNA-binding transcriptional regulator [Verrucomicrobiae bacterium]
MTLKSIAVRARVSIATVSLALSGRGMVARSTAERVRALAEEMGYRPNPLLASLAARRFRSPAVVGGVPLAIFNFPSALDGSGDRSGYHGYLAKEAKKMGYAPKVYDLTNRSDPKAVFKELYHGMAQGVVITGSMDDQSFGRIFDWSHFSTVQCARFHSLHPFHTVRPNIFQAVKLAFTELRARGYERIGFAIGRHAEPMEDDEVRYGAAVAMEGSYLPRKHRLAVYTGNINDREDFLLWFDRWKPDAVVGFTMVHYWFLKEQGVRIPQDTGFACLHLMQEHDRELFSGLCQNMEKIARQSILLLDQMIRHRERGRTDEPLNLLVSSSWNEGQTVRGLPVSP